MCVHLFIATPTSLLFYPILSSPGKFALPIYYKRRPKAEAETKDVGIVGNVLCNKLKFNMRNTWIETVAVLSIELGTGEYAV